MDMLSDEQMRNVILAYVAGCHPRAVPEAEIARVLQWAKEAVVNYHLLELILAGRVQVRVGESGKMEFQKVGGG